MAQNIQTPPADAAKENKTKRKVTYTPVRTVSGSELREMAGDGSGVLENEWNDPSVRTFTEDGFKGVYPVQPPEKYHTDEDLEEAMPTGNAAGIGANMVFSGGAIPPLVARELYKNETSRAGNTSGRYARMKEERAWRDNEAKYAVDSAIADGFKPDGTSMRNIQEKYVASYYYTAKGRDRYNRIKEETNRLKEYLTPYIEQETAGNPLYQKAVADYRAGKISMEQLAETQEMLRRESPSYKKAAEWSMQQNRQYAREASDYFSPYIEKEMVPFLEQGLDKSISDFRSLQGERPDEFTGVADNLLNKAEKLRDAARNGGFLMGMGDTASDWNFWSLGIADLYRAKNIREIADKADKALREGADVEFTPEELNTLQAYAIYQQALNLYSEKVPLSYTMGQVTAEMIPFATSIALGQGLVKLTTKGISAVAKKAATREVAQAVSQALGKSKLLNSRFAQGFRQGAGFGGETTGVAGVAGNMLGGMTRGTGEALTVGAPRTWAEKNERMTGQADIDVTDSGQPLITGFSGRESGGEAFAHALAGNAIEYQSERAGQLIDRLGGALKARLPKDLQLSMGSLGDYIKSITPKSLKRFYKSPYYKAFKDNIQLQGVWSEYGEEELANWERVLLGLDEPDVLLDNEQRVETFLSLLPAQLMMGAGAGVYSAGRYRQASARLDKLMKEMKASDPELYEKYGKVRGEMDGFDVKAVTGLLSSIDRDGKLDANQKTEVKRAALAEYYTKMLKSAQEAEIFGRADEEMKQAYEQAEALKERGSGNIVTADYEGRKVNITDDTGSDTVVIEYVDEDGKRVKRQVPRSAVGNAATVPVADVVNSKADEITARVKTEMQELEHPGVAAPEPGMRLVHNGENYAVTSISPDGVVIMREDEEGNNSLPEVISLDTYYAEKQAEIDAQEQEQQPQGGENGEAAQKIASPAEVEPAPVSGGGAVQEETALGRIPKDEQGQPLYEQADAETAWDALLEQAGGDEAMAQEVANEIVSEQEKALKAAEKELKKVQDGKPQQRKGDAPLTVEARIAAKQAVREQTSRAQAGVDEARKRLEAWRTIAETPQRRRQAIEAERRQEEQEAARLRGIQEEQERAEREEAERIRREALNGVPDFIEDRPQDARARGYRRVNGNRVDRQEPIQARRGGEVQVKFDDNNIPTGHTALIEASQLQPSHTDGRRNPRHFIDEAQPKERNDEASVMSARKIAANIRPEEITSSVTAYTGAPTVNSRGEVIQGNNRSAALREMWAEHPEQAAKYRQYLADHAADFGLTPEDVEAMQQPVLVNMLDVTDDAAITLGQFVAQDTESGGTERIKPKNMVQKMGDDMRIFAGKLLASADEEMSFAELVDRNGADVLKWMQQKGYITPTQYKSAFDSKGNLTAEAKNDLKGVMYQSIFQNGSSHLEEMFNALPAKAQKAILATAYRDYDSPNTERMIEEIQNSISAYHALSQDPAFAGAGNYKEARIAAEAWKRQYAFDDATGESYLPSERYSNFALLLATMYKGQTQKFIQNTLGHIYDLVQGTQEADLFNQPDNTPRTLVQAINETLGNLREELLLNENFTYNGQRRSNVLAGGSEAGQRGRQGSDGNAPSGGRAENGARTATDKGRTVPNDTERGGQGDIRHSSGRQQDNLGTSEGEVRLSDEIDENGRQFVLTSNGQLSFGEITEESGLTPAPILLSEGIITNPATNDGYGLVHIEARHGDQIRKAGYKSVIEFIEDVAQNYERVKEGNIRNGNPTYLIQLKDKHNNTLIVELSSDGNYWNINTAGIFKESYGKNRREIYNRHTTVQQSAETVGASQEAEQSGTTTSSSMNAPTSNIVSETPVKTEPQQPNNAVSTGSSLSENEVGGITSSEPNGKPTVSGNKDSKTSGKRQEADRKERGRKQIEKAMGMLREGLASGDFGTVRRALGMYWTNQYHGAEITEEEAAFVDGVLDNYRQQGIEIINPLGTRYDEGMKVVADFRTDDTLKPGENRIVGVREPQVNTDGVMSHSASITVAISPVAEESGAEILNNKENSASLQGNQTIEYDGTVSEPIPQGEHRTETPQDSRMEEAANRLRQRSRTHESLDGRSGEALPLQEKLNAEAREAESYAKETGQWIPMSRVFDLGVPGPSGNEADTYVGNDGYIYKVNNLMNSRGILPFLERYQLHNQIFPESKYELVGFTGFDGGSIYPVFRQQYVPGASLSTPEEIDAYMQSLGFHQTGEAEYSNGDVTISDLRPRNVLRDADSDMYVIDAEFRRNERKTFAETSQERQKNDSNLSEAFKQQMNIRIGQLSKFIKTKDGKLKKKYESLRKTPFFAIFDSGNIYEGPVAIAKTPREALNVAFNYDIGDFEVLYVDFRTKSLDMDLLSIYDVSGFRGDVYDENGAYKDEAKNLLVERISRLGKGNSTEVQGVEDFQQRESGADALQGNADENIRRAESEVERNPTEAQKEAGNYRKGHVRVDGLDVTIENPKGSVRSGTDADGKRWENVMNNTYGYMRGTEGVDGDHIDVFLSDNPESGNVYVVDQRDPKTGEFDEHKVMYGFGSMEEARDAYLKNYTPGWQGLGTITEVSKDEFRKWIGSSKRKTKPFAEYKSVKKEAGQNEDVRQSRDGSNPLSAEEAAIRDAIVERLRESGIEVITDTEAGQKVLDEANGRGEPVRTQALLDGLAKAASTIRGWIKGNRRGRVFTIDLPESTQRKIKEAMGRDFDSHNITANGIAHALKNHGVGGYKLNERSIPLREEDMELIPYIMTAPDDVKKASTDVSGRESVRFYKNLSNGYVVVVEKEYKNSPDDMETITMWAELSSGATNARQNAVPDTHVLNAIPSTDSAKIRKDAEDAIHGDEKVREHRVYHGSGADFEAFDHSHMGEGEGAQAYGWGSYVTEVEGIGRTYAKASTENKRENATVYKRRQIRDNEISINVIRGMIAEYPEQHREREKRLSDLEKELADQNSQKGRIEKESGKDSVAYRNFMFYAEDIIKDLERNIERTKRSIEDEAGYNEQRKRQVEELVAENARLQSEIDAIEAQYPRHLYTVEIPDDTGENYLEWEKPVTKEQQGKIYKQLRDEKMTIKGASQSFWNGKSSEWQSGQKLIDFFIENLGSDKAASEFLSRAGFTGISYPAQATTGGRKDGARNYVIFDEKDLQITDHVRFFRTPGGEAYGFTVGGKIYIDPRTTTADTPIHEYAHLWAGALRQANPKEWNNIVDLMRDTPAWDEVKRLYPELESDEEIADEALAMYSGRRGAERLREAARRAWDGSADLGAKAAAARAMGRVRDALRRFWQNVADLLHFRHISAEEVADRVMRDLMEGVNPNRIKSATDNTGAFSAGNDDIRYSRAEEDKSLVAVHNTSEENLKKALELGGFPMPSIAVTKADVGHTEFGEISLVFGRESIDPTDRRNKVYGEDAWAPTFPQTGYKLDEKKTNDIYRRANKAGSLPLFNPVTFHPDNYESYISGLDSKSLVEHFKDDYGAKQLYLYENGNAVDEWERHEVEKYLPDQVALSTKLLEEIGLERLKGEKDETLEYEVKRIVNDHYGIDLDGMPPFRAKIRIGNAISRAVDYAENGNRKTEADAEATKRKIDARTDQKDFEKWLEDLFDGIVEKRGIRNDKDPFTASGNRRKWEQLYDEITLDNVVEAMRRQAARGGQGLFGGSIFGAAQEEYKDIDSIRKAAKRRIRMMSHEEAETGRKTITDRLSAIEIPGVGERFSDVMDMVQNIQDAVARSHTAKGIYKYLKAFYPKVTMETANEIADIVKDIQAMSARYFEAKPYRAVGFDEVRLAVVPSDTDAGLVEQLKRKGIPVREYERGNEAERRAIVEEATDEMELRFRETEEEDANRRFNEELEAFKEKRHKGLLHIGVPGNILMACGVNADLTLSPTVLHRKLKQHGLSIEDIRNLPEALQHPIMVYRHGDKHPNLVVVTDMEAKGGKISAAIELNADGNVVEINNISSIHSKDASKELNRLAGMRDGFLKQALRWVDKEKVSDWLGIADLNSPIHASDPKLVSVANIVKDFENPALEDENLFRIGETKRIGGDSLFGRRITFTRTNPTVTLNAMKRWVLKNADLKEYDVARTGSRYLSFTHNGVDYKIRSANHTRAYDGNRPENSGLSVSVEDRIYGVEIDLAENEMVKEDILRIIEDTDRLNDTGLNLQNTVESGLLPDEMVSADRELTDAVIREVREMAEWRLDSARTKAESEYEREHPLEDYKADNGIMILNRYFYGRVSYEVKFPDGWRGKTKQPRADAIQEYEDSDAHRRNMEQASGMNVYVDGRTKAQAETLRKIDGLANRLEQERMAGAVREMAERLHLEGVEVVTDASTLTGRRARAKGFYSPRTGKISIVIPNHASEADAVQTLLHEAVAHKGLRQLFGEHFDTFLWNVYRNADRDVRERINALASDKGWDFPTATEEYLASLAENTDFENAQRSGWWEKIKRLFIDMLHKMGLDRFSGVTLSDNELRYILWRSYENLREPGAERSITGVAADVVKQAELKVGNYAEEATGGNMAAERGKKEASETDSVLEREHQHTVISDATGTKILNNLDNLVKRYENSAQSEIKTFIGEVSKAIGARRHGSKSEYATFETKNGKIITIRLSDHNASTRNFDNAGRNNGISIVITARKNNGVANDGNAHVVEFYYDAIKLRKTAGKPLAQIVRSIQQSLYSGEYHDTTGLAVRDEVNNDEDSLLFRDGSAAEDGTRDTPLSSPTIHAWDRLAQSLKFQLRETAVDYLTAIDKFQDLIAKHSGRKIESFENAYDWMTFLSSRNRVEMDMFDSSVVRPLNNAILKLTREKRRRGKWKWDEGALRELVMYVEAKHGTDRNRQMAVERYVEELPEQKREGTMAAWTAEKKRINSQNISWIEKQRQLDAAAARIGADIEQDYSGLSSIFGDTEQYPGGWREESLIYAADYEAVHENADIASLWNAIDAATGFALRKQYETGLVSREYVDRQRERFEHYIPLRGFSDETAGDVYSYIGHDFYPGGNPVKTAHGRMSEAGNPFGSMLNIAYSSISAGNKNMAKTALYALVRNHDTDGLAVVNRAWMVRYDKLKEMPELSDVVTMPTFEAGEETPKWVEAVPRIPEAATSDDITRIMSKFEDVMTEYRKEDFTKPIRKNNKTAYRTLNKERSEHDIPLFIAGEKYVITVTGNPRPAQAMNGLLNPDVNEDALSELGKRVQRFMAGAFTGKNAAFSIANLFRDTIYANNQMFIRENPAYWLKFTRNQRLGFGDFISMMRRLKKFREGTLGNSKDDRLFQEFMQNGGATGYTFVNTQEEYARELAGKLDELSRKTPEWFSPKGLIKLFFDAVQFAGESAELVNRFAAYKTSREMGRTMGRSIRDAKEITVNFNRKGAGRKSADKNKSWYSPVNMASAVSQYGRCSILFWNANMQGKYRFYKNMTEHPVKTSVTLIANNMALAAVVLPLLNNVALPMLYELMGLGDDGDDENYFNVLTDWERTHNICVRLPKSNWLKIPISPDFVSWFSMGDAIGGQVSGEREMSAKDFITAVIDAVSPLSMNWSYEGSQMLLNFAPTVTQPLLQNAMNVNFMGNPLKKTPYNSKQGFKPEYQMVYSSASPTLVELSRLSNRILGGTDLKTSGWADWNPAELQNLISGYTGGYGTTFLSAADWIVGTAKGEKQAVTFSRMPLVSRFAISGNKDVKLSRVNSRFYDVKNFVDEFEYDLKSYEDAIELAQKEKDAFKTAEYAAKREELIKSERAGRYQLLKGYVKAAKDCEDYLEELPEDEVTRNFLYNLKQEAINLLYGEYKKKE